MKRIAALILLASLSANAFAFDPFVVSDIRIDGLSRISAGTVFNYLPINKGDRLTNERSPAGDSCLVQHQVLQRRGARARGQHPGDQGGGAPVDRQAPSAATTTSRPMILKKGLKEIGLTEGETFDRLASIACSRN